MSRFTQMLIASVAMLLANFAQAAAADTYLCITDGGYKGEATATGFSGCSVLADFGQTGFLDGSTPIPRDIKLNKSYDTMSAHYALQWLTKRR